MKCLGVYIRASTQKKAKWTNVTGNNIIIALIQPINIKNIW